MVKKFWQLLSRSNQAGFTLHHQKAMVVNAENGKNIPKDSSKPRLLSYGAGFTITEMIVVLAIIGLIAGLTLVNYRAHERQLVLESETQKLVSVLRQIQMMALAKPVVDSEPPQGGYGFYWIANSYLTFAEIYPPSPNYQYDTGQDKIIQNFSFPSSIVAQATWQNLIFKPPKAEIYLNGVLLSGAETITLTNSQTGKTKTIQFNGLSGKIEIQ